MGIGGAVFLIGLYFIPTIVAMARHHHNALAVGMLNFFLGWTFIGWVVALVWACTAVRTAPVHRQMPVAPAPVASLPSGERPKFDVMTGRPIVGYDPYTGAPVLGERTQPET